MVKIGDINLPAVSLWLAPMEGVTNLAFRLLCKPFGVDVTVTEFISSDGLVREVNRTIMKLEMATEERPAGIQIYGNNATSMTRAAQMAEEAGPDFIDINFGCSVRKIARKGFGAGMLNDIPKMVAITREVVNATRLPVTVKTRLGWDDDHKEIVTIAEQLQDVGIQAIIIHGRTKAQVYQGAADWTLIGEVKNNPRMHIPVIGNGDICHAEDAKEKLDCYGVDGIMVGRATYGNPWIFEEIRHYLQHGELPPPPTVQERVAVSRRHLEDTIRLHGERFAICSLRRHYASYFRGYANFKPFRQKLVTEDTPEGVYKVFETIIAHYSEG